MVKPPSPQTADDLAAGIGHRRPDAVGQSVAHRGQHPRGRELHVVAHLDVAGRPGGHGAAVAGDDGVLVEKLVQVIGDHLRLHRLVLPGAALFHQLVPLLHPLLGLLQKAAVLLGLDQGQQRFQDTPALADQADVRRKTQPDARRVNVNLDALGLARLGVELHVGEAAAGDNQGVALLHGVLRGGRAEQADAPRGEGTVVGDHALAEQGLDDRAAHFLGQLQDLLAGVQTAAPGQDGHLGAGVDQVRSLRQKGAGRQRRGGGEQVGAVLGDVGPGAGYVGGRPFLDVLGDGEVRHRPPGKGGLDGLVHHVVDVGRPHDPLTVRRPRPCTICPGPRPAGSAC